MAKDKDSKFKDKESSFGSELKEEKEEPVVKQSKSDITIDHFFSQSREARKGGSYLEKGFRKWWQTRSGKNMGHKQGAEAWLTAFKKYATADPKSL
jgi:hypothetical protein